MLKKKLPYLHNRNFLILFSLFAISRVVFAAGLPLGVDEAYQITVGWKFDWSYYDHPPLSFWLPRLIANLVGLENVLIYRIPSILFGCVTVYALYGIGIQICGKATAFWSAFLYCISPFFFFSGGIFVLPDGMLNASICMAIYLFLKSQNSEANYNLQLVMVGFWLAVSFLSKYHSIFLPLALLIYFFTTSKRYYWIFQSQIWIVALIGSVGALPILIWNHLEGWPTFIFHSARANSELSIFNFVKMFLGQLIYLSPPTLILAIWSLVALNKTEKIKFLIYPATFIIVGFNVLFLFGSTGFPHWTMPGWMLSLPLVGLLLKQKGELFKRKFKLWLIAFMSPTWLVICAFAFHVNTGWLTKQYATTPKWDNTLQFMRWNEFEDKFADFCCAEGVARIGFLNWVDAALLGVVLKDKYSIRIIEGDPHHFKYRETDPKPVMGYLLVPVLKDYSNESINQIISKISKYDKNAEYVQSIGIRRGKEKYAEVLIFRMLLPQMKV